MSLELSASASSKKARWTGRILSGLPILFLLFDSAIKLVKIGPVVDSFTVLGYPDSLARVIGCIELVCLVLYMLPRTSVLGAILLTGYLGGAVTTHLRVLDPLFSHTLFPIYVGAFVWAGLYLREGRLRALIPLRN